MRTQTPQNRVQFACALRILILGVFAVFTSICIVVLATPVDTDAATSSTINFQARLETGTGSIVPDGTYNVEFKLYSAASGGTAEWTEDYTYNSGPGSTDARIRVANGYLSVNLGSITPFPGTINWNQQQWLTMNIGGTGASGSFPTMGDGEMSPRLQLTAVPYAFQAGALGNGSNSAVFDSSANLQFNQASIIKALSGATGTALTLQGGAATSGANVGGNLLLQGGAGATTGASGSVIVRPAGNDSATAFQVQNAATGNVLSVSTLASTSGTIATFNAPASFTGSWMDLQENGVSYLKVGSWLNGANYEPQFTMSGPNNQAQAVSFTNSNGSFRINPYTDGYTYFQTSQNNLSFSGGNGVQGANDIFNFQYTEATGKLGVGVLPLISDGAIVIQSSVAPPGTSTSDLQIGYSGTYGWIQSYNNSPFNINPLQNDTNIGNTTTNSLTTLNGTALVKPTAGHDSATAFQVQNAAGSNILAVDTTNTAIVLGNDGTPSPLTVRGGAATGSNAAGSNLTFDASNGTGVAGSGALIFRTAAGDSNNVAYDNSTKADDGGGCAASSLTKSFTIGANSNRLLIVSVVTARTKTLNATTGVQWNGANLTKLDAQDSTTLGGGAGEHVELWYAVGPSSGTANIVVNVASGATCIGMDAVSYYNVNQTTPLGTATHATNDTTPSSNSVSSNATQLVYDTLGSDTSGAVGSNVGGTVRQIDTGTGVLLYAQDKAASSGSTSMGWTGPAADWEEMTVPINPIADTSPDTLTDRLHISANGNVGVNNANPQYTLDVTGTGQFTGAVLSPRLDTASSVALTIGSINATAISMGNTTNNIQTTLNGTALIKPTSGHDSTSVFRVQNASGSNLFTIDTTNTAIVLGNDGATSAITVRGGAATTSDTAGSNITFDASNGTGSGGSGDFIFRTASPISNAVTLDNSAHASDGAGGTVTSLTISNFAVGNHTNRILIVSVSTFGTTAASNVKFGTVALGYTNLTLLDAQSKTTGAPGAHLEIWYMLNPTVQTADIVITTSAGTHISAGVASYYNVNQVAPTDASATGYSMPPSSVTVPSTNTKQLIFDTISSDNVLTGSNTAGATVRWNEAYVTADGAQDKPGSAGSTTMGWTWGNVQVDWVEMALALSPPPNITADTLADRLHIAANGNIGINNTSPQYTLDVTGKGNFTTSLFSPQLDTAGATTLSIGTVNASAISVGNATNNILTTINGTALVKPTAGHDSAAAFQVQKASGAQVLGVDTSASQVLFGAASSIPGKLVLYNATNANTVTITTGTTSGSYMLALPTAVGTTGQCLQANVTGSTNSLGWGTCGGSNTVTLLLTPEYANTVLDAASDATCSSANSGTLTANLDLTNRMNYYKWTTTSGTNQCYDVVVQVPIPSNFSSWAANPLSITTYTSDTTNGTINLEARDSSGTVQCNYVNVTPASTGTWTTNNTACTLGTGTFTAGGYITLRVRLTSPNGGDVRVGNISLRYISSF